MSLPQRPEQPPIPPPARTYGPRPGYGGGYSSPALKLAAARAPGQASPVPRANAVPTPINAPGAAAPTPANQYLRTKVLTATPEQLQLMLYDGAIRFCERAKDALFRRALDESYEAISRAQKIVTELNCSLKHDAAPDLCRNLSALYTFAYLRLVEANIGHEVGHIDDALQVLRYQRETWVLLLQELGKSKAATAAAQLDIPQHDAATARIERLSMTG